MAKELNYDTDTQTDLFNLHLEWVRQSSLMMQYGKEAALAKKKMQVTHERVKVIRSSLIKSIKKLKPNLTQQQVEAYYRTHPRHKKAKKKHIDAEYTYNMILAAIDSLRHKKSGLEDLVRLHGQQYFSDPNIPKELDRDQLESTHNFFNTQKSKSAKQKVKDSKKRRKKNK